MIKEINEANFVNLANDCVGIGLIPTGKRNYELAKEYSAQQSSSLIEALKELREKYLFNQTKAQAKNNHIDETLQKVELAINNAENKEP